MAATHAPALTSGAGHHRVYTMEKLPRATIYSSREFSLVMDSVGQILMETSYELYYVTGQSELAMSLARTFIISAKYVGEAFQGSLFSGKTRLRRFVWDLHLLRLLFETSSLALFLFGDCIHDLVSMVREHARSRRGSAWEAHRAQRRRKKQLERALSLASSILRKKAREERRRLLDTIIEPKAGYSRDGLIPNLNNVRDVEHEMELPTCIVEDDPSIGDLPCFEAPRTMEFSVRAFISKDDVPGCIIEEIPWMGDSPSSHAKKTTDNESRAEQRQDMADSEEELGSGTAPRSGLGGEMHGFLLSDEHLALVFELRSHLADMEFRMLLMSQRLDILLGAFSGAPAQHKCPLCAQEFSIPARSTWQAGEGDDAKGD
jgi:hypothetical protein